MSVTGAAAAEDAAADDELAVGADDELATGADDELAAGAVVGAGAAVGAAQATMAMTINASVKKTNNLLDVRITLFDILVPP